jgi:predicted dehydrogenase
MTGSTVRIGLVGYGMGGRYFHAPLIAAAAGCELAGVVTRSPERRAELAQDAPGVPAYDSLADLAAAGVDAVVVSTPLPTHLPLVREAVGLGLPVVCDKPFAADAVAARATVELAARAGVLLSVYQNRRWDADLLTVSKVLASGALGDIITFESHLEQSPPTAGLPTTGGGVLLDLGAHAVDQAMALFGPVSSVYAELHVLPELDGFDNRFFVALQHRNGVTSHLWGSWGLQGEPISRFRVIGSAATYAVDSDDGQTDRLLAGRTPATEGDAWGSVPEARWGRIYRDGVGEPVPTEHGSWNSFYAGFASAVRGQAAVPVNPWDAVAALEVLGAARTSATQGRVVELNG